MHKEKRLLVIQKLKQVECTTREVRINRDINIKICEMQIKIRDKKNESA